MTREFTNRTMKKDLLYPELSYKITGVLFKVHNKLGRFCREKQYCDLLESELKEADLIFGREKILPMNCINEEDKSNKVDFCIENKILLEIKSKKFITKEDYFQTKRYLKASNFKLGLIVNFRSTYLKPKRVINLFNYS